MTDYKFSDDFNEVYRNQPAAPVSDAECEISVVHGPRDRGIRCVYVNNHRVVGGKPYVSEGLSSTEKTGKISDVLDSFSGEQIRAYLEEKANRANYFKAYHEWKRTFAAAAETATQRDSLLSVQKQLVEALADCKWLFEQDELKPLMSGRWGDPSVVADKVNLAIQAAKASS